jgi:hypothetical protein
MGQADGRTIGCSPTLHSGKYSASTGHKNLGRHDFRLKMHSRRARNVHPELWHGPGGRTHDWLHADVTFWEIFCQHWS